MAGLKKWSAIAAGGTALCLAGVVGLGAGVAGAGAPSAFRHAATAAPAASVVPGTYNWVVDGAVVGTITFASGNTWSSSFDSDTGEWVQGGKAFTMDMTGGSDGSDGCLFAAKVGVGGTSVNAGSFDCSISGATGTWSAVSPGGAPTATSHGNPFARTAGAVSPLTSLVLGTYNWFINGTNLGTITYEAGNVWTSNYDSADGGTWLQAGKSLAMDMTTGTDGTGGCIFAGKVNHTGTKISKAAKPGAWICPGYGSSGSWYVS